MSEIAGSRGILSGRAAHRLLVASVVLIVLVAGSLVLLWQVLAARARLAASTRVAAVGVDDHGYWFVRIEVQNVGNLPWEAVSVSSPHLVGNSPPAVEVGSTLPVGTIPERFEFVIETVAEGVVPQAPELVKFDLHIITEEPWYLPRRRTGTCPFALPL